MGGRAVIGSGRAGNSNRVVSHDCNGAWSPKTGRESDGSKGGTLAHREPREGGNAGRDEGGGRD